MISSPIRWVGGKQKLRSTIVRLMPPVGTYSCYVEVFGGAAWVLFGKDPSPIEVLNDIDGELTNFWKVVKYHHEELMRDLGSFEIVSERRYIELLESDPRSLSPVQRAHRFFYLIMGSWGGEIGSARFQTSKKDGGGGNRLIGALAGLETRLRPPHRRLARVIITAKRWQDCIARFDGPSTMMYLDPPYPQNNCNYAHNMRSLDDHKELSSRLRRVQSRWLLTIADRPDIVSLYKGFTVKRVRFASGMDSKSGRVNRELIITNYDPREAQRRYFHACDRTRDGDLRLGDTVRVLEGKHLGARGEVAMLGAGRVRLAARDRGDFWVAYSAFVNKSALARRARRRLLEREELLHRLRGAIDAELALQLEAAAAHGLIATPEDTLAAWIRNGKATLRSATPAPSRSS